MDEFPQPDALPQPSPIQADYLYPAFWSGLCSGILSGVPLLSQACCLWMTGGGTLAVYFFQLKNGFPLKKAKDGARVGLFSGIFGGLISVTVNFGSQVLLSRGVSNVLQSFRDQLKQMQATMPTDPQAKEAMAWAMTPEGTVSLMIIGSLAVCVVFMLLSMAGGALGVRSLNRDSREGDRT